MSKELPQPLGRVLAVSAACWVCLGAGAGRADDYSPGALWNGLYVGLHGSEDLSSLSTQPGSAGFGLHLGYGVQAGALVLGVEGDADKGSSRSSNILSPALYWDNSTNWTGTLRGRVGVAFDVVQIYGTAGAAYRNTTTTLNRFGQIESNTQSTPGVVYGAGIDWRILPKIDVRAEALHYDYSGNSLTWLSNTSGLPSSLGKDQQDTVVRIGVSLRMN
jgi:outer membrane immunogenic protein